MLTSKFSKQESEQDISNVLLPQDPEVVLTENV